MDYRSNLAFIVFVAAVVTAVVGAVLLLSNESGETSSPAGPSGLPPSCRLQWMGGAARILSSPTEGSCAEARDVFATFREMTQRDEVANAFEPSPIGSWTCQEYPFADFPLLARCSKGELQREVIGTAPYAHEAPQ